MNLKKMILKNIIKQETPPPPPKKTPKQKQANKIIRNDSKLTKKNPKKQTNKPPNHAYC